jgi:hypothetical protein
MKVNLTEVVMVLAIGLVVSGCCSTCRMSGKCSTEKCNKPQCGVGMNANVGGASAGAGINSNGAHVEAKTGL